MVKFRRVFNPVTGKVWEFDIPLDRDLYYTKSHSYARIISDNLVRVGFDDFAQQALGTFWKPKILPVGSSVEQFGSLGSIGTEKMTQRIISPISGEIVEINPLILERPKLINEDPYNDGWILDLTPTGNLDAELQKLYTGKKVIPWLEEELDKFMDLKMWK